MLSMAKKVIIVATNPELTNPHYYARLWLASRNLCIPRRKWLDELADCFCSFDGELKFQTGENYQIPLVDETFGDDPDCRWLSYYFKSDCHELKPLSMSRMIDRLRLIDAYFRIKHPSIARHFGK